MSQFADDYLQQLSMEKKAPPMAAAHEERSATPAKSGGSQPNDAVLTKWLVGYDACTGDDASLVCAAPSKAAPDSASSTKGPRCEPVPPPFNVDVPGMHCVPPPRPTNWAGAPSLVTCPTEMMSGEPTYKPAYESENLEPYKAAFGSSWSDVRTSYNGLVTLHRVFKDKEKEIIPILQVGASRPVREGIQGIDATRSFVGGNLRPSLTKIDSSKFSPDFRAQLFKAQDKTKRTELDVGTQRDLFSNANHTLLQALLAIDIASNDVEIAKGDTKIENLELDKDGVRRDLEDFRAKSKATVESGKLVTSILSCLFDPSNLGNVMGVFNQAATMGGAIADAARTVDANDKLARLDGQIRSLKDSKGGLLAINADKKLGTALIEAAKKVNDVRIAVRAMKASELAHRDAYRDMGTLIEKAAGASGLNPKDRKAVAGAVEAVPKIEMIQQHLQGMDKLLQPPPYSEESGIGATMASNVGTFTHALSVVKGNREYVVELKALWESRRASVLAVVDQAASVTGED